ncbi:hypothetical protein ACV3RX_01320 [Clostridium perfringens]|uniref:hypothetical protein n=1 Tax=Clostridium perfringens TaxID=1502 RepID=UPI000DA3A549|nr:hypothetical protein [Clostridium perfringens]EHA1005931.1 hypothetical protein [Clostridium perfringens]EHA1008913.1 hypothetical protein [Clostridium perfringens]EHA1020902.1 hypothetical protein [Clostridium perfringens]SQI03730.1 Uncharacterised protein [Clostridium perfringens]
MSNISDCRCEYENDEEELKVAFECTYCGNNIYVRDDYYEIGDIKLCCECIDECKSVAEDSEF